MTTKNVLLIGLDPAVVNYDRWPGLTAEKLEAGLQRDEATLKDGGYDARICFVTTGRLLSRSSQRCWPAPNLRAYSSERASEPMLKSFCSSKNSSTSYTNTRRAPESVSTRVPLIRSML